MAIYVKSYTLTLNTGSIGDPQNLTISGIGTPVAAEIFISSAVTNAIDTAHCMLGYGMIAGSSQACIVIACENGVNTSNSWTKCVNNAAVVTINPNTGVIDGVATASLVTDGVQLTVQDLFPAAYIVTVVFYVGDFLCNVVTFDTDVDTNVQMGSGYRPDLIRGISTDGSLHGAFTAYASTAGQAIANFSVGIVARNWDGSGEKQYSFGFYSEDAIASGTGSSLYNGVYLHNSTFGYNADINELGAGVSVVTTSTGVTISSVATNQCIGAFLAINFKGNHRVFASLASASVANPYDLAAPFKPQFTFLDFVWATEVGVQATDYGISFSLGFMGTGSPDDFVVGGRANNNSASSSPTICGSHMISNFAVSLRTPLDALDTAGPTIDSADTRATFSSFDWKKSVLNFVAAASSYEGFYVSIGPSIIPVVSHLNRHRR